jgi:hypothetical protein
MNIYIFSDHLSTLFLLNLTLIIRVRCKFDIKALNMTTYRSVEIRGRCSLMSNSKVCVDEEVLDPGLVSLSSMEFVFNVDS